jgi:type IV pilus assembly protein PilN
MLRINLLPIRQLKKRAKAKQQIAGFCVIFICFLVILGAVYLFQVNKISSINKTIASLTAEKTRLAPQVAAVEKLKKDKEELNRKITVINQLKAESSITVHILDEVANVVDNNRMWLTSLNQQGDSLTLTGIALDNQTIAQFMNMLKTSPYIQAVNLSNSSLKKISDKSLKEFALTCAISLPQKEQTKAKAK